VAGVTETVGCAGFWGAWPGRRAGTVGCAGFHRLSVDHHPTAARGSHAPSMAFFPDAALRLGESQLGVYARYQLLRWLSADVVDGHRRRGLLINVERGVYRMAGSALLPEQAAIAAALRSRPSAVITGPFVLGHLRVDGFSTNDPFDILLTEGRKISGVGFPHRPDPFPARNCGTIGEVRIAAPVDALIETALWRPRVTDRAIRVAYDQLRWSGRLSVAGLERHLERRGSDDPAVIAFREAVGSADLRSESEGERRLGPVLTRLRPLPEPQVWVTPKRRVDWYLRYLRLGWEYLGDVDHGSSEARAADAARDEELAAAGVKLLYVTARDLEDPPALLTSMMGAIVSRADHLGVEPPRVVGT
jgi:hypothetical protein